jgi:hypothetical protein
MTTETSFQHALQAITSVSELEAACKTHWLVIYYNHTANKPVFYDAKVLILCLRSVAAKHPGYEFIDCTLFGTVRDTCAFKNQANNGNYPSKLAEYINKRKTPNFLL